VCPGYGWVVVPPNGRHPKGDTVLANSFKLLKQTCTEWSDDRASSLAAAVAFYTLISMAPLLLIVLAVAGFFFGPQAARGELFVQIRDLVGPDAAKFIQSAIDNAGKNEHQGWIASVVNIGVLLFGATNVFAELQDSLNTMWGVKAKDMKTKDTIWNYLRKRVLSFAMVLVIAFLLLVSLVVSAVLAALTGAMKGAVPDVGWVWHPVNVIISLAAATLLFAMIYKVLPDVSVRWRDTWVGAAITAALFTIGKALIGLYLGNAGFASTYGAAGALVVTVVWVYYSAQILFFGAEFTQVYAAAHGTAIVPDEHAVRVEVVKKEVSDEHDDPGQRAKRGKADLHQYH
jgi:membrane protein